MDLGPLIHNFVNSHLLIAAGLGALIGLEREFAGKDPSLRTFTLICLGNCIFSLMSVSGSAPAPSTGDPARIGAQIVSGIGFLGAGAIFRSERGVSGMTTAALMWVTAAIGMAVGFDRIDVAVSGTIITLALIFSLKIVHRLLDHLRPGPENN